MLYFVLEFDSLASYRVSERLKDAEFEVSAGFSDKRVDGEDVRLAQLHFVGGGTRRERGLAFEDDICVVGLQFKAMLMLRTGRERAAQEHKRKRTRTWYAVVMAACPTHT